MARFNTSRSEATKLDKDDPLHEFAHRFQVPEDDDIYMIGNSLGPLSTDAKRTLDRVVSEWRNLGIRAWTDANPPWFHYPEYLGKRLAPLLGAEEEEVVAANSTTVNIHTLIGTFLDAVDEEQPTVLIDELNFPTDGYAIRAQLRQRNLDPEEHLVVVESSDGRIIEENDIAETLKQNDIDLAFFPSVLYRSGQLLDIARITDIAHEQDTLIGFDLAHSVGVIPHELSDNNVDFAVLCSYKYLNAGPGAVAGLYVNQKHFGTTPALAGWYGHEKETQFDMNTFFTQADTAGAWQIGTIPMLSAAPLEGAIDIVSEAGIETIREKSLDLTDYLISLVDERLGDEFAIGSPQKRSRRGGHVALEHPEAHRLSLALKSRGIVVDFRPPNVIRLCPSPLYIGFEDMWEIVTHTEEILDSRSYENFEEKEDTVT